MNPQNSKNESNKFAKYTGAGMQMLVTIGLGVFVGIKIDEWLQMKTPWFTVICSLLFIFLSMYGFIKSIPKE
ncbi:MAG: AtpZ/AtpI family protein [Pseudarcicella sp.]|nr:AtpZ/AtpI family protein [Pseudarcicella sp.]MBP6410651.1 AtpZ/AtpI family protein [Pseudarcicella sp.]